MAQFCTSEAQGFKNVIFIFKEKGYKKDSCFCDNSQTFYLFIDSSGFIHWNSEYGNIGSRRVAWPSLEKRIKLNDSMEKIFYYDSLSNHIMEDPFKLVKKGNKIYYIQKNKVGIEKKGVAFYLNKSKKIEISKNNIFGQSLEDTIDIVQYVKIIKSNEKLRFNNKVFNTWHFQKSSVFFYNSSVEIYIDKKSLLPLRLKYTNGDGTVVRGDFKLGAILEINEEFLEQLKIWN
jgi:hypothetical protein